MEETITYPSLPSIKVGGMRNKERRIPLYGSIRFAVTGKTKPIFTKTNSIISEELQENEVYINKERMEGKPKKRVENIFYEFAKKLGKENIKFRLESENVGYPTGGGLASSAAGLGGSTLSLYKSLKEDFPHFCLDEKDLTRIARLGSTTAIGSITGSYSKIFVTDDDCWGERISEPNALPDLSIVIALVKGGTESDEIHRAMEVSTYRDSRLKFVEKAIPAVEKAILEGDTSEFIDYTHKDTRNFHGAIMDQGIFTFKEDTIKIFNKIEKLRKEKTEVGCSIAGGPIPIILTTNDNKQYVLSQLEEELKNTSPIECRIIG